MRVSRMKLRARSKIFVKESLCNGHSPFDKIYLGNSGCTGVARMREFSERNRCKVNISQIEEGSFVSYGAMGVCRVTGTRRMQLNESMPEKTYFELHPARSVSQSVFVPVDNEQLCAKIRRVMTKDEVDALLGCVSHQSPVWEENKRVREENFRRTLAGGFSGELVLAVSALHQKKQELAAKRRHLTSNDERVLKTAERLIEDEVALAAGIDTSEVSAYVRARIGM